MPGVDTCVFAHVCRNTDSAVRENISRLGGLMLLKKTLKNCSKEDSMHSLKAEKINSNNICYIWKTRPKLQIVLRNIYFSISNRDFLCFNSFYILKIHSHVEMTWTTPISGPTICFEHVCIGSVHRAGEKSKQVDQIDTSLPAEIEFRLKQTRSWCAEIRGSQTWMVSKGSWLSVMCKESKSTREQALLIWRGRKMRTSEPVGSKECRLCSNLDQWIKR